MNEQLDRVEEPPSVAIADKVRELSAKGMKIARMQTGEPCFDTPRYIIEGAYEAMLRGFTHYSASQGLPELRKEISLWYESDKDIEISPGNIIIHNGAVHAVFCILSAVINADDEVIIPEPFWPQYKYISILAGAQVRAIDTSERRGRLSVEMIDKVISDRSKVLIINNPCNPSGIVYSRNEIEAFLEKAYQYKMFVLFDEVYGKITYTDQFCSVFKAENYEKARDLVVYVNSFSKAFAMTGWRVGYSILPDSLVTDALKISQNSITNVSTFCQWGAKVALERQKENEDVYQAMLSVYRSRYEKLLRVLKEKGIGFIHPEGAFYFLIECGAPSKDFAIDLLEKSGIAVVPGAAYGENFDNYYRISFAVEESSFARLIEWIESTH